MVNQNSHTYYICGIDRTEIELGHVNCFKDSVQIIKFCVKDLASQVGSLGDENMEYY